MRIPAIVLVLALAGAAHAAGPASRPAAKPAFGDYVRTQLKTTLEQLQSTGDFVSARDKLAAVFDQVIAYALPKDQDLFRETVFALRLVQQLEKVPTAKRLDLLKFLRANDALARTLVFVMQPQDRPAEVYAVLDRLREKNATRLDRYATLAAAVCVVHDRPLTRHVNENKATAPDAVAIFDYYVNNESRMLFGIKPIPAELLIYVVDTTASIDEMNWALQRYAGNQVIGRIFFEVKYDYQFLRTGRPKAISAPGMFNLPNILEYGGVCADQAHYATSAGKAIGVPTAVAVASAGEAGHAWVGFFQASGGRGFWNFNVGRYEAYRGISGHVQDPQTREGIPDSFVSLLAEMIGTQPAARQTGTGLADAAVRLITYEREKKPFAPTAPEAAGIYAKPRKADTASELELLELAIRQSPGDRACWLPVHELGKTGKLTLAQKKYWADVVIRFCGNKYPDFMLAILARMVETVDDAKEQDAMWNSMFTLFRERADLAAYVRMTQAALWEGKGEMQKAGLCYYDVIEKYPNSGPWVIDALQKAEKALRTTNRADRVPMLYEQAWMKIPRPMEMAAGITARSNWYRIGQLLVARLNEAGQKDKAEAVKSQLEARVPSK